MNEEKAGCFVFILLIPVFIGGIALGYDIGKTSMRKNAVKAGVAKFVATDEGQVEFHWTKPDGSVIIEDQKETK